MRTIEEFTYTKEDFYTEAPYEYITSIKDPFLQEIAVRRLGEYAKSVKFIGFKAFLGRYIESLKKASGGVAPPQLALTRFEEQPLEIDTGEWIANDYGICKRGRDGALEIACSHPIMPAEILCNIDTGERKARVIFRRGSRDGERRAWNEILVGVDTLMDPKGIVKLAGIGVSVNAGKRAQNLSDYFRDVIDLNYDIIPQRKSVSKMGWNEEGFSPYSGGVVFDGNENFRRAFDAIKPVGNYDVWKAEGVDARKNSVAAKIVLAASFASVLVGPLGCLPFFLHLWGGTGTGKTVSQMLAASVWAEPSVGGAFFQTFKTTDVGVEVLAGFLNSLPLIMDDLQLKKDRHGNIKFDVYALASGAGKLRSNKSLGLAPTATWANCFITTGESPLVNDNDGAGALNRVIDVNCSSVLVIADGHKTAETVKRNYGHAGKEYALWLEDENHMELAKTLYAKFYEDCLKTDTTTKQAMAAALILTADSIATTLIFKDGNGLTLDDLTEFLKSAKSVSLSDRGYAFMCDWVSQNANKLRWDNRDGEVYGGIGGRMTEDSGYAFIVRSVFNRVCQENEMSAPALLSQLKSNDLIKTRGRHMTVARKVNGIPTECVAMKLPSTACDWTEEADLAELIE